MNVAIREAVYECTYASAREQRTARVRAWDAREAGDLFAHELRGEGVDTPGRIQVRGRGEPLYWRRYQ